MFKSKLAKIAAKTLSTGNYKPLNDIILQYPAGVYVNGITVKAAKNTDNAIALTFNAELSNALNGNSGDSGDDTNTGDSGDAQPYFFAESGDLKKLVTAWQGEMSLDEIDSELAENPVVIRVYKITTRNNREYVKCHIVEDTNTGDSAQ